MTTATICFGPFRLKPAERLLERDGAPVLLGSRALDLLIALVEHAGEAVSKRELMDRVWPDLVVVEGNLRTHVAGLRKVLGEGEGAERARYITNLPGRGYCFVAPVEHEAALPRLVPSQGPRAMCPMPPRLSRMVGRDEEVVAVAALVRERRFASIVGPGGMGKTTVAVAVAHELAGHFDGHLGFVDLAALADPELVTATVSASIGAPLTEPDPLPGLLAFVAGCRMLIVLDNCEHLVEAVAGLAEQLCSRAPDLCLLATSREALRVEGEHVHFLAPLPGPPDSVTDASELLKYPAGQLFMERAVASGYREALDPAGTALVAGMCHRLDGIALAIELVASRVGAYGVQGTAELLDNRFKLLWHGRRSALPRHQTLHAMLDWSFNLLSERDRAIFARLGAFAGLFDLAAAKAVAGAYEDVEVEQALDDLVEKSLVWTVAAAGPSTLYRLPHVTRDFALHQLEQRHEKRVVAVRHAQHVNALLEAAGCVDEEQDSINAAALDPFIPSLRAALEWSFSQDGDRELAIALAMAAAPLWLAIGRLGECRHWSTLALDRLADGEKGSAKEAALQQALATSAMFTRGNDDAVQAAIARGVELAGALGQSHRQMQLLAGQHIFLVRTGAFDEAVDVSRRSLDVAARLGSAKAEVTAEWMLGTAYHLVGRQRDAQRHCERGFAIAATNAIDIDYFGYDHRVRALIVMARCLWIQGQWDRGISFGRNAVKEAEQRGHPVSLCIAFIYTATVLLWNHSLDEAETIIERLIKHATRHSLDPYHACGLVLRGELRGARGEHEAAIEDLQRALSRLDAENHQIMNSGALRALAQSLMHTHRFPEALNVIDDAVDRAGRTGGKFDLAELHRTQGEIRRRRGDIDGAQAALVAAIAVADEQNAMSWRLRSGEALTRLLISRGRADEAYAEASTLLARLDDGCPGDPLVATRDRLLALLAEAGSP